MSTKDAATRRRIDLVALVDKIKLLGLPPGTVRLCPRQNLSLETSLLAAHALPLAAAAPPQPRSLALQRSPAQLPCSARGIAPPPQADIR